MQPAIPTLVDLDEWLRARLRAKTIVCELLPSFGKPSRGGRSRFRRPPRKGEQHGDSSHEPHRFSTLATSATTGKQSQPTSKNCLVCLAPKRQPSRPQNSGFCRIIQSVTPISPTKSASSWMLLPNTMECL